MVGEIIMKNLRSKRVVKLKVGDLKEALVDINDDTDVVLGFYMKDKGVHYGYLATIHTDLKYDSVIQNRVDSSVVELSCFNDDYCNYVEREDDS